MPSRASLSLSLPLSYSIPLSSPQLFASVSLHFHQLHPLFHPCAFHSLPGGLPSSSIICLFLSGIPAVSSSCRYSSRILLLFSLPFHRDFSVYCPLIFSLSLPLYRDTGLLSPSVYISTHTLAFSIVSLFLATTPSALVALLSLSHSAPLFLSLSLPTPLLSSPSFSLFLHSPNRLYPTRSATTSRVSVSLPDLSSRSRHLALMFAFTLPFFSSTTSPSTLLHPSSSSPPSPPSVSL